MIRIKLRFISSYFSSEMTRHIQLKFMRSTQQRGILMRTIALKMFIVKTQRRHDTAVTRRLTFSYCTAIDVYFYFPFCFFFKIISCFIIHIVFLDMIVNFFSYSLSKYFIVVVRVTKCFLPLRGKVKKKLQSYIKICYSESEDNV